MEISETIFREYDIRGVYDSELTAEVMYQIGMATGAMFADHGLKRICIGRDNRESSEELSTSFAKALLESGMDVVDAGLIPYPMTHFITTTQNFDGGINITASHNPKEYNGVKIEFKNAMPLYGAGLLDLYQRIKAQKYVKNAVSGKYEQKSFFESYLEFYKARFNYKKSHRLVVNCGNGATSEVYPKVLEELGVDLVKMNCVFDSTFPEGVPDPEEPGIISKVSAKVKESSVEAGIIFDGDGDRFGLVDEKGNVYSADYILLLFSKYLLSKKPGSSILFDVKCTRLLEDVISRLGGKSKMIRTGRSYFLQDMLQGDMMLGAEFSGHHYNKDNHFGYDDGLFAACYLLEILDATNKPLSALMAELPKRESTPEIKVPCADTEKFKVMEKIKEEVLASVDKNNVNLADGVRVNVSPTGWYLIRVKNTSPFLTVRVEGETTKEVTEILDGVISLLSKYAEIDLSKVRDF